MLDQTFGQVYTKFKLHFYKQIFNRFEDREVIRRPCGISYGNSIWPRR